MINIRLTGETEKELTDAIEFLKKSAAQSGGRVEFSSSRRGRKGGYLSYGVLLPDGGNGTKVVFIPDTAIELDED